MAISDVDVKRLWGLAAGRCSKPGCEEECIKFLDASSPTVIGEMAHVIAKQPDGPRGVASGGEDLYENLILLCPTHHTEIDKAPVAYPVEMLHKWKREHEARLKNAFATARYRDRKQLGVAIKRLLLENKRVWQQYGPESAEARQNPISNLHRLWTFRKLATIVPNNRKIVRMVELNKEQFELKDYVVCTQFVEHAEGFEHNCYIRTEGALRFPVAFEKMIDWYAEIQ